jgi:hypothetical protein
MLELSDDRGGRVVIAPPAPNRSAVIMTQRDAGIFPAKARRVSPDDDEPLARSIAVFKLQAASRLR